MSVAMARTSISLIASGIMSPSQSSTRTSTAQPCRAPRSSHGDSTPARSPPQSQFIRSDVPVDDTRWPAHQRESKALRNTLDALGRNHLADDPRGNDNEWLPDAKNIAAASQSSHLDVPVCYRHRAHLHGNAFPYHHSPSQADHQHSSPQASHQL